MRQVFASPRLANVEGIAKFLEEHDIEVRITHGRSYKSAWSGRRTYRDDEGGPQPAVWVVRSEDQPRARQLLREAGLLGTTRASTDSFLAPSVHAVEVEPHAATPQRRAFRYKLALLAAIAVAVALAWGYLRKPRAVVAPAPAPVQAPARSQPKPVVPEAVYHVDTPPVLAETLFAIELDAHQPASACVSIDGKTPPAELLAHLRRPALPVTACTEAGTPLTLEVGNYLTDGSGTGTIELAVTSPDQSGRPTTQIRTLQVRRVEADWHVLRVIDVR